MIKKPIEYVPEVIEALRHLDTLLSIIGDDKDAWERITEHFEQSNSKLQELLKQRGIK